MNGEPLPPHLRALAAPTATALTAFIASVIALIAHAFVKYPTLVLHIIPICTRLRRAEIRFARLMARVAAGIAPRPSRAASPRPASPRRAPRALLNLPRRRAWLLHIMQPHPLRHEAAIAGTRFEYLLAQPGVADLLAAVPRAHRILNPLRHFLGLPRVPVPRIRPACAETEPPAPCAPPAPPRARHPRPARPAIRTDAATPDPHLSPKPA